MRKLKKSIILTILCSLTCFKLGCYSAYANFEGTYVGDTDCFKNYLPLNATFYKVSTHKESTTMMFYRTNHGETDDDQISITMHSTDEPIIGQVYRIKSPTDKNVIFTSKVTSNDTCSPAKESHYLTGEIVFDNFSTIGGETISGRITNGTIINARTNNIVTKDIVGEFNFEVKKTPPHGF